MNETCPGCGAPIPARPSGSPGRPRKWCSDKCKRRTWDRENVDVRCACGTRLDASHVRRGTVRCRECRIADDERRVHERAVRIAAMWADGQSMREIADALGCSTNNLSTQFAKIRVRWPGLLPHRYRVRGRVS